MGSHHRLLPGALPATAFLIEMVWCMAYNTAVHAYSHNQFTHIPI